MQPWASCWPPRSHRAGARRWSASRRKFFHKIHGQQGQAGDQDRLAYGGVYEDAAAVVPEINEVAAALEDLIPAAEAAKKAGRFRDGHRLIVVVDDKQAGFWEIAGGPDGRQRSRDAGTRCGRSRGRG